MMKMEGGMFRGGFMKEWELIGGLLRRIGNYNVFKYENRIAVQKLTYILQYGFGDNLGYHFNWYVHGPYSPQLAKDFYKLEDTNNVSAIGYKSRETENRFEKFVQLIGEDKYDINLLEIVASMIYVVQTEKIKDKSHILERVKELKPYFNDEEYSKALHFLIQLEKIEN